VNGAKTWTSNAHDAHYMITLVRTGAYNPEKKHENLSQLIIDLHAPGVTITPISYLTGEHHFNDVFFDNVFVPDDRVVGMLGNGWKQGLAELAFERSGPERILSTFPLLNEAIEELKRQGDERGLAEAVKLVAEVWSFGRKYCFCSSVPKRSKSGPVCRSAIQCAATGAPAAKNSSVKI